MQACRWHDTNATPSNGLPQIGVGTGANLEFYPAGSRLHCVDPNQAFEVYFRRECLQKAAHLDADIRFVAERGESMPSVADGSVDVVVSTLVLCSVTHLDQMFREIRRVLAPVSARPGPVVGWSGVELFGKVPAPRIGLTSCIYSLRNDDQERLNNECF